MPSPRARRLIIFISIMALGCSRQSPLETLFSDLKALSRRERAIDGLLVAVREAPADKQAALRTRVAHALGEAYRLDRHRGAIISALALLKAPEGEEVFSAALADFRRGGEYFEAAIRSARLLGELKLKARIPELVTALEQCLASPRPDRNTWLERTLILALTRLPDKRAVPVLTQVLARAPELQDFYLNKLAARALGGLGDVAAAPALVRALGVGRHGLLLFEESRRALCRLGPAAAAPLRKAAAARDHRGLPGEDAARALTVLGDLGQPGEGRSLEGLAAGEGRTTDTFLLAQGEALLRLGSRGGVALLQAVLDRKGAPLTSRVEAARLLGLYGQDGDLGQRLLPACKGGSASGAAVLCWRLALAHTRLANPGKESSSPSLLEQVAAARQDAVTAAYLKRYRSRLGVPVKCAGARECLEKHLAAPDWRVRERAALDLGRAAGAEGKGGAEMADVLAARYKGEHDQVKQAILVGLERMALSGGKARKVLDALPLPRRGLEAKATTVSEEETEEPPGLSSRLLCLRARLARAAEEQKEKR